MKSGSDEAKSGRDKGETADGYSGDSGKKKQDAGKGGQRLVV
jgi:hypothetical protein